MITPGIILSIESTGYFRVLMVDCSQDVDYESIIIIIDYHHYLLLLLSALIHSMHEARLLKCAFFLPDCHGDVQEASFHEPLSL